jgi:hypothetical protein
MSDAQTLGRSDLPNSAHRKSSVSCTQRTPAGLPLGMPGIGVEIEGAIQHAPQWGRQSVIDTDGILVKNCAGRFADAVDTQA